MCILLENESLRNKAHVFRDRTDAGMRLSEQLIDYKGTDALLLAIPSGGVPVAYEIKQALNTDLDLIIVRKVQIPWNPEAGFGAVNLDGDIILNEELLQTLKLTDDMIETQIQKTRETIRKRDTLFRKGKEFPRLSERTVFLVDDGLASGYTIRAAIRFVQKRKPSKIVVAVPTGSSRTIEQVLHEVDTVVCLNVREGFPFAVADAYRNWHDLSDHDVLRIMGND